MREIGRDLNTIKSLVFGKVSGESHKDRLEAFYGPQAKDYDRFRERLLAGRDELYQAIPVPRDGVWVDMGGGTASNLEALDERAMSAMKQIYVVDLSSALLERARERIQQKGWKNVTPVNEDVLSFSPKEGQVDVVTFSYSLTMIPDWFKAIDHARRLLKPGGRIGVTDFYIPRKHRLVGSETSPWWTRTFWPVWFAFDNVHLSSDHLEYLKASFAETMCKEWNAPIPYLSVLGGVPRYIFIGTRK